MYNNNNNNNNNNNDNNIFYDNFLIGFKSFTYFVSTISLLVRLLLYSVEIYSVLLSHDTFLLWCAVLYIKEMRRKY